MVTIISLPILAIFLKIYFGHRKEINDRERKIQNAWDQKFYYLSGQYFRKVLEEESAKAEIPVDTFERKRKQNPTEKSLIPLKPSPMPVPETSSAMIGWRSSRREYDLEFSGPLYVSDKHTIEPPLLPGEFRVTKQHVIFLG